MLSKEEWRVQVRASVQALAPSLDPDRVVEKHITKLQQDLRSSAVNTTEVLSKARELANGIVLIEAARCPVTPTDLLDLGIEQGPRLGLIYARIQAAWERDPTQSREDLLKMVQSDVAHSGSRKADT
jgi:hypothetical protein